MKARPLIAALAFSLVGCAGRTVFSLGPRPAALAGTWIDSLKTTETDSSFWVLDAGGTDSNLRIRIVAEATGGTRIERDEKRYGSWYVSGAISDTTRRALCVVRRARDGGTCTHFRLDTLAGGPAPRRRLVVFGYRGDRATHDRVLLERLP